MARQTVVTLLCDLCGSEDLITTHTLGVDSERVEFETCEPCWAGLLAHLAPLATVGRKPAPAKLVSRRKAVVAWPGESWELTSHALIRLGERKISPIEAMRAAEEPTVTTPGQEEGLEVRVRGRIKVVVHPRRRVIITAARRDEAEDNVA